MSPASEPKAVYDPNENKKVALTGVGAARIPYVLYYRQGNNPMPQFLVFNYPSGADMRRVVERAKAHCEAMGYRFVNVRPFVVDLDLAERRAFGTAAAEDATGF